ncbi:Anaphase-promoting complex subunit 4 [Wickerhamomyces ciferrii]|uniref:Anaphase-promoting complex subunit 4 n=1 Tax=Wickerhamomyces ciferrii (strain ATCC 14091 / BCRC 22168 / CBS 111 / JCM 3599 / NBRC 0793 / NRRL Y-1031 F-60-10) TaxID=1206466 RepID=K0KTJ1_WICCF|nr:Anaphase-promoting complex subunit 4 [Wickerhamomyces ciferrii]CCH46486.1 Anaphase-promoting complex subunit 4 [Wickerhamomyces ciferrii]
MVFDVIEGNPPDGFVCSAKIDGLAYSWCPTMDLVAFTANNGKLVVVYRKNGSKVWELTIQDGLAKGLVWRPDGKQFAVITTKNKCLVYESNTARLLTEDQIRDDITFGEWVLSTDNSQRHKFSELVDLGLWKSLPKLPPLPNSSKSNTFTTKVAIDGLIQQNDQSKEMNLLMLFSESKLQMTFNALFSVESIDLIGPANDEDEEIVAHISQNLEDHYIITSSFTTMKLQLRHFKISMNKDYRLVHDLTSLSSKIIALSGYINEILIFLAQDIRTLLEFSNRFVGILKDELQGINDNVGDQLYDLLLTGMMSLELKDWLENTLGERGITRWSKTGEAVFENTRRTIFYHLIPSCERLITLLSHIKGTSKASISQEKNFNFDIIDECTKSAQNFMKLSFQFIINVKKEQELFGSFVNWIHAVLRELQDEEPRTVYKTSDVSEFINSHLERSSLMMLTPQFRRHFNEIKINTNDLFTSIKSLIKDFVSYDSQKYELGVVTEKQKLKFQNENLYIYSHGNAIISIYKFDTNSQKLESIDIETGSEVYDIQISKEKDEIFIIINDELICFQNEDLFNQHKSHFKFDDLIITKRKKFPNFHPKYLTLNTLNNIGSLVSQDLQKFIIFNLDEETNLQERPKSSSPSQPELDSSGDLIL